MQNDTIIFFMEINFLMILVKDSLDVPHGFLVKLPVLVNICKIFGIISYYAILESKFLWC